MNDMIIAIAQIEGCRNNIEHNIGRHLDFCWQAAENRAGIIVFPEMSLTSYETDLARKQSFIPNDSRFLPLQDFADRNNITVIAGCPLLLECNMYIASALFRPRECLSFYIKKYLHPGEESFFNSRSDYDPQLTLYGETLSFAICYDIENDDHANNAAQRASDIYIASIFYSTGSILKGCERLASIARTHSMMTVMSNYTGSCWNKKAGGCSSLWDKNGNLVASADADSECLLLGCFSQGQWAAEVIRFE